MAWGYWSATTISDRGRSPRRNQNGTTTAITTHPVPATTTITTLEIERPCVTQTYSTASTVVNSNNQTVVSDYEVATTGLTRRPSLDLGSLGPQGALAGILCAAHGSRQQQQQQQQGVVGTLSAGNTLTRVGSRHTAVEYAVPHHFHHHHHHHHAAYVEYHHQAQLSFSDDDSSSEPGYATGLMLLQGMCVCVSFFKG